MKNLLKLFIPVLIVTFASGGYCQNTNVTWSSFSMGYAEPKTGNTAIKSMAGQNFVGSTQQLNTLILSGFLADTIFGSTVVDLKIQEQLPTSFSLWQNYPNPFNPNTTIHFELPRESHVTLKVYDMLGQEVLTALDEEEVAGKYDLKIDGTMLASGIYFYRLCAETFVETKKLILIK